jgi:modification methylase
MSKSKRLRRRTNTSAFGAPGRISHDASAFYNRKLYENTKLASAPSQAENPLPEACRNQLFAHSSENMAELPEGSVHLMITSPPYNASKEYDQDLDLNEYLALLMNVWRETYRVLVPGGRACINIANLGRKPYLPIHAHIIQQMQELGFLMRGEIIWDKAASASASTAWGSWLSAANPVLRDVHEYILVFSKGSFKRQAYGKQSTITRDQFLQWTKSVWQFPAVSASKVGHPAPFPEELPYRLIQLYSFAADVVLDPFTGSGTTCLAAVRTNRIYVGYDTNPEYIRLALQRLSDFKIIPHDNAELE